MATLMLWQVKAISAPHYYISGYFEEHRRSQRKEVGIYIHLRG